MNLLKNVVVSVVLALPLSTFSAIAVAGCSDSGQTCTRNDQAIENINTHIDAAIKSITEKDVDAALANNKKAKRAKKELNSESNAAKIGRVAAHFHKVKKLLKAGDLEGATAELQAAKSGFNALEF